MEPGRAYVHCLDILLGPCGHRGHNRAELAMRGRHCHEHPGLEAARAQAGIASNARQSRRADAGSIHSRGEAWVWALGADADSGLLQLSAVSEGFESGLVVSDGRGVPRRGGAGRLRIRRDGAQHRQRRVIGHGPTVREQPRPDPLDIRTGPVVASAAHPCGRRSMHARSAARYAIGPQPAFGRSGFRAPAFHVEPGQPRCSGLEDAAWALGA